MGTTVINNQSLLDLAIQLHGSVEQAFALAIANGFSVTDKMIPGSLIDASGDRTYENPEVLQYFEKRKQKIATASSLPVSAIPESGGIGYMIIEENFIVS